MKITRRNMVWPPGRVKRVQVALGLIEGSHWQAHEFGHTWQSVRDGSKPRERSEGVVLCKARSFDFITKLLGVHKDAVRLGILGESNTFDKDVGASSEGDPGASRAPLRLESATFSRLGLLFSVSDTFEIMFSIGSMYRIKQ